jgi:hypothetical protein
MLGPSGWTRSWRGINFCAFAEVVELVDALRSGRSGRKPVRVRVPPSAWERAEKTEKAETFCLDRVSALFVPVPRRHLRPIRRLPPLRPVDPPEVVAYPLLRNPE